MGRFQTEIRDRKIEGFKFILEYDTGAAENENYVCWIGYKGKFHGSRWFKNDTFSERHYNNFINKFAKNKDYRFECIKNGKVYGDISKLFVVEKTKALEKIEDVLSMLNEEETASFKIDIDKLFK